MSIETWHMKVAADTRHKAILSKVRQRQLGKGTICSVDADSQCRWRTFQSTPEQCLSVRAYRES